MVKPTSRPPCARPLKEFIALWLFALLAATTFTLSFASWRCLATFATLATLAFILGSSLLMFLLDLIEFVLVLRSLVVKAAIVPIPTGHPMKLSLVEVALTLPPTRTVRP